MRGSLVLYSGGDREISIKKADSCETASFGFYGSLIIDSGFLF